MIEISIVIPTYNCANTLIYTLESLEKLNFPKEKFEVLIIDDGSTDNTTDLLTTFKERSSLNFRWIRRDRSERSGPGISRNLANENAKGYIIACTDADCMVDSEWLNVIYKAIVEDGHVMIGGKIITDDFLIFPWKVAPAELVGVTANLAFNQKILGVLKSPKNMQSFVGHDVDIILQAEKKGYPLHYVEDMIIIHPHNKFTVRQLITRILSRKNEVLLRKRYGYRIDQSMNIIFKPILFNRVSLVTITMLLGLVFVIMLMLWNLIYAVLILSLIFFCGSTLFLSVLYKFCIMHVPTGMKVNVTFKDRLRTLLMLYLYFPIFLWARIVGSIQFKYLLL